MAKIDTRHYDEDDFDSDEFNQKQERIPKKAAYKEKKESSPKKEVQKLESNPFKNHPTPVAGDIVLCYYPEREDPTKPGPKARPCIVLAETVGEDGKPVLHLVAGTSKKLDRLFPHEFIVKASDMPFDDSTSGLRVDTKFDMSRLIQVPYTEKWLMARVSQNSVMTPVLGRINTQERKAVCDILDRVKSQLKVHDNANPKKKRNLTV